MIPLPLKQGQQLSVDSSPVVLASDGALPLPTGAATETTLALIKTAVTGLTADISSITTGIGKHTAADQVRRDCATANLTASIDTSIIASTTAAKRLSIFNGTGVSMILKVDTVQQMIVPPGGISEDLVIVASKVLSLNPYTTCTDGEIVINTFA